MQIRIDPASGVATVTATKPEQTKLQSACAVLAALARVDGELKEAAVKAREGVAHVLAVLRKEIVEAPGE